MEKNQHVGGHASQLKKDGYTFDMGPSLITAPDIIQRVFHSAKKDMHDYLDLIPLDPFYRIYFHDGQYIDYSGDSEKMKKQMEKFSSKDALQYDRFMRDCSKIHKAVITDGLGSTPFMNWKSLFNFLPRALKLDAIRSTYSFVKKYLF